MKSLKALNETNETKAKETETGGRIQTNNITMLLTDYRSI